MPPHFYIQLVYKPHCGAWILLFRPFDLLRAVRKHDWEAFQSCFPTSLSYPNGPKGQNRRIMLDNVVYRPTVYKFGVASLPLYNTILHRLPLLIIRSLDKCLVFLDKILFLSYRTVRDSLDSSSQDKKQFLGYLLNFGQSQAVEDCSKSNTK